MEFSCEKYLKTQQHLLNLLPLVVLQLKDHNMPILEACSITLFIISKTGILGNHDVIVGTR